MRSDSAEIDPTGCDDILVPLPELHQVIRVDVKTGVTGKPIEIPGSPAEVAVSPNGATAYVVTEVPDAVVPVDLATGELGPAIALGDEAIARSPVVSPDGRTLVLSSLTGLVVIDLATWMLDDPIELGFRPLGPSFTPDSATVLVGRGVSIEVTPIDMTTRTPEAPITLGGGEPISIPVTPDGRSAYVANYFSQSVSPIDLTTRSAGPEITLPTTPSDMKLTPDGTTALIMVNQGVLPLDVLSREVRPLMTVTGTLLAQAVTPDGATDVVVSKAPDQVTPVDLTTGNAGTPIPLPSYAVGVAAIPADQAPVASVTADAAPAGEPSRFDASGSIVKCGSIRSYEWDFGDGTTPQTTTTPNVEHTYTERGTYIATVTEIDSAGTSTRQVFTGYATTNNGGPSAVATATLDVPAADPSSVSPNFTG